jgi:addiction module RelE/StbE family toxin
MRVVWSRRAQRDLHEIRRFIARDNPEAARRWIARLRETARKAADHPLGGRRVPELNLENLREALMSGYRIVYRVEPDSIFVLMVFEGHRLLPLGGERSEK